MQLVIALVAIEWGEWANQNMGELAGGLPLSWGCLAGLGPVCRLSRAFGVVACLRVLDVVS